MKVLGISGSLRRDSHNTMLLRAAAKVLPPAAELELYDDLWTIPPYSEDVEALGEPDAVTELKRRIAAADAVLFATPEYNHSLPGQLKNALDWISRPVAESPMRGMAAAVIGASTSAFGALWAQAELRKVLGALGAHVIDRDLPVAQASDAFDADGALSDRKIEAALEEIVRKLIGMGAPRLDAVA